MEKAPTIWNLRDLLQHCASGPRSGSKNGQWVPARPIGYFSLRNRIKAAWAVFTGRADAVTWPAGQ